MSGLMPDAFPRTPAPHDPPTEDEIAAARAEYALHIPSLFTPDCLAEGCRQEWPCRRRRRSFTVLDRAGLIDINGDLRV